RLEQRQAVVAVFGRGLREGRAGRADAGAVHAAVQLRLATQLFELRFGLGGRNFHRRPPIANARNDPSAIAPAAIAAEVQPARRYTVGTSGFTGRLYARSSPRMMNIACVPPTLVSRASYSFASLIPCPCSFAMRASAACCIASRSPNRIEPVGHAFAHAGCSPNFWRS